MLYLTPDRFRTMGLGVDLDDLEDVELRSILSAASAKVNAYCNVPMAPQPYSFFGGTVTNEVHSWDPGSYYSTPQNVIVVRHIPVKEVTSLRIHVTETMYATVGTSELFLTPQSGLIELTSLAMIAQGPLGVWIAPQVSLGAPQVRISYTYGYSFSAIDELLEPTDARFYQAASQFWDDSAVTVTVDGVVQSSGYTIDRTEGGILFDTAQAGDAVITASYGYTLPVAIATATGYIAADTIGDRELRSKGMAGVRSLRVGEITIERDFARTMTSNKRAPSEDVPLDAQLLLEPFRQISIR